MKENEKGYIQKTASLRMMLAFNKYKDVDIMNFAFRVLKQKKNQKSSYVTEALQHYDQVYNDNYLKKENEGLQLRLKFIKSYYSIDSKADLKAVLSCGRNSATFENATEWMLPEDEGELREVLLGFSKMDPEQKRTHDRLFKMEVNDRMFLIAKAIKMYIDDGQDNEATIMLSFSLIHDLIIRYENLETEEEKDEMVDNYWELMEISAKKTYYIS